MSDERAGQEGPTPDFIPGWFEPRPGNSDPATREAVRVVAVEGFPVAFLRPHESVSPNPPPHSGVTIYFKGSEFSLVVPPGYWIVRNADGELANWSDEDFKAKWSRSDQVWRSPTEEYEVEVRAGESPSRMPADLGEPPAEGTRRRLILETIREHDGESDEGQLELADAIEMALLEADDEITDVDRLNAIAKERWERIGELEEQLEVKEKTIEGLASTVDAQADCLSGVGKQARRDRVMAVLEKHEFRLYDGHGGKLTAANATDLANEIERAFGLLRDNPHIPADYKRRIDTAEPILPRPFDEPSHMLRQLRELHVLLEPINGEPGVSPDYRFVEIEDQDGNGVKFDWQVHPPKDDRYFRVVIPYDRDDTWARNFAIEIRAAQGPLDRVLEEFGVAGSLAEWQSEREDAPVVNGRAPDEFDVRTLACERLHERLSDGPVPGCAELARVIDILR